MKLGLRGDCRPDVLDSVTSRVLLFSGLLVSIGPLVPSKQVLVLQTSLRTRRTRRKQKNDLQSSPVRPH